MSSNNKSNGRHFDETLMRLYLGEVGRQPQKFEVATVTGNYKPLFTVGDSSKVALARVAMVANVHRVVTAKKGQTVPVSGFRGIQSIAYSRDRLLDVNCHYVAVDAEAELNSSLFGSLQVADKGHRTDAVLSRLAGVQEAWKAITELPSGEQGILIIGHLEGFGMEKSFQGTFGDGTSEKAFLVYAEAYLMPKFLDNPRKYGKTIAEMAEERTRPSVQSAADILVAEAEAKAKHANRPGRLVIG